MQRKYIDLIKSLESPPKIIKMFSDKEIQMIQDHYRDLPESTFNKKTKCKKKSLDTKY